MYVFLSAFAFSKTLRSHSLSKCAKEQQQGAARKQFLPSHILTCRTVEALCNKKKRYFGGDLELIYFFGNFFSLVAILSQRHWSSGNGPIAAWKTFFLLQSHYIALQCIGTSNIQRLVTIELRHLIRANQKT